MTSSLWDIVFSYSPPPPSPPSFSPSSLNDCFVFFFFHFKFQLIPIIIIFYYPLYFHYCFFSVSDRIPLMLRNLPRALQMLNSCGRSENYNTPLNLPSINH